MADESVAPGRRARDRQANRLLTSPESGGNAAKTVVAVVVDGAVPGPTRRCGPGLEERPAREVEIAAVQVRCGHAHDAAVLRPDVDQFRVKPGQVRHDSASSTVRRPCVKRLVNVT